MLRENVKNAGTKASPHQHHLFMLGFMLVATVFGIGLGVCIADATAGTQGLLILVFALTLVNVIISLLLFTQFMHMRK